MATKSTFQGMLNQKLPRAPGITGSATNVQQPEKVPEFAYLNPNTMQRHPMGVGGSDIAKGVWAKIATMKPKGVKNV